MRKARKHQTFGSLPLQSSEMLFSVQRLKPGREFSASAEGFERLVVIMSGRCGVAVGGHIWHHVGRRHTAFFGAPYVVYVPLGHGLRVWSEGTSCEFVVVGTRTKRQLEPWLATASDIEATFTDSSASRESEAGNGIVLAQAGVDTDRLTMGERLISPGTAAPIPIQSERKRSASGEADRIMTNHVVHYRLFPADSHAFQWQIGDDAAIEAAWTVCDGDSSTLLSERYAAIGPPGTYVYYLWAAAVDRPPGQTVSPGTAWGARYGHGS